MIYKRKIGIEVQRIFRKKKHGMEVVALELIRELQNLDRTNEYILYCRNDVDTTCVKETMNFKVRVIKALSYFSWEQLALPSAIKKDNIEVLHSTCNTSVLFSPVPVVLTLHDIIYLEKLDFKGSAYQNFGNLYRRFVVPRIVARCEIIITVSKYERTTILKKFPSLDPAKVRVIYNAVSSKFHASYPAEIVMGFRRKVNLPETFILFLGNTAPKKNTLNVIKAYIAYKSENIDGIPLAILDLDKDFVFKILEELGKQDFINDFIFPGYIPAESMPLLYSASKLFLYPSLRESFGLPILEAMACGVPVITSNTSAMPEVAGDAALFVDPADHLDIKNSIVKLLQNEKLHQELAIKGLKRASTFTWKAAAEQLLQIYNSLKIKKQRT